MHINYGIRNKRGGPHRPPQGYQGISLEEFPKSLFGYMVIYFKLIDHDAVK